MRWIPENASNAIRRLNPHLFHKSSREIADLESNPGSSAAIAAAHETAEAGRFLIRIESHRKRTVDCEGLCCKFDVDLLRYAGIIPNDTFEQATLEVTQIKCRKGEPEHVLIQVFRIETPTQ